MHSLSRLLFFAMFSSLCLAAESSEPATHGSAEIEQKPVIEMAMAPFITAREVSGVVTLVADQNEIIHLSADGRMAADFVYVLLDRSHSVSNKRCRYLLHNVATLPHQPPAGGAGERRRET